MAADKVHNTSQSIVGDIKSGLHGIHGAGEALRGGAMEALDGVFHKKDGEVKDREIYDRGVAEMRGTEDRFETKQPAPRNEHQGIGQHHASHGQGSHFAGAHARDVPGAPHTTAVGAREVESSDAAKRPWQEKH